LRGLLAGLASVLALALAGCEGGGARPMVAAAPPCPAPIESDKQVVVDKRAACCVPTSALGVK
jgi:hypothetical protein